MIKRIQDIQGFLRTFLKNVLEPGDIALDLTAGRGRDTLFLAQTVGPYGRVYAFDIQQEAIHATRQLLESNSMQERVELFCMDHSRLGEVVTKPIKAAMFNLGYLPGGDTGITTKPESTIKALSQALRLLQVNGMIVLTIYRGHEGGSQEAQGVNQVLMALSKRDFSVLEGKYINQAINSPYWVVVQKNRGIIYES